MNETVTPDELRANADSVLAEGETEFGLELARLFRGAAARIEELEEALRYIGEFAKAHHDDQPAYVLLHGLTIDIPDYVERAVAGSFYAPIGPAGSRSDATESEA